MQITFQSVVNDESWLCHLRFGHLNFGVMNLLHRQNMVKGFPLIQKPKSVCEGCILGKQHRETFPFGKSTRPCAPLEIIHSDICEKMKTISIGGCTYFLTSIDVYRRKTQVYFFRHKS